MKNQYLNQKPLTIVKPEIKQEDLLIFIHTVNICYEAFKANKCKYYSISHKSSFSILQVASMFKSKVVFLKPRLGERYASSLTKNDL